MAEKSDDRFNRDNVNRLEEMYRFAAQLEASCRQVEDRDGVLMCNDLGEAVLGLLDLIALRKGQGELEKRGLLGVEFVEALAHKSKGQ